MPNQTGGTFESDQYGNLVETKEGSGTSIGEGTGVSTKGNISVHKGGSTGGTQIVVDTATGQSMVIQETPENLAAIEQMRQKELEERQKVQELKYTADIFKKQGIDAKIYYDTQDYSLKAVRGQEQYVETLGGGMVKAPLSATVEPRAIASVNYNLPEENKFLDFSDAKPNPTSQLNYTPGGVISSNKNKDIIGSLQTYGDINQDSFLGIGVLSAIGVYSFGKGTVEGFIGVFKPSTYTQLFYDVSHPGETVEKIGTLGEQFKQEPASFFEFAGSLYGMEKGVKLISPIAVKAGQKIMKLSPDYVPIAKTNVEVVEGVSKEVEINLLREFEDKTVPTVHATFADIKSGSVLKPQHEGASAWRKEVGQFNFYSSSPTEAPITKVLPGGKEIPATFEETPLVPRYNPVAYGGYIGIGESETALESVSLLPQSGKAMIFREAFIKETPKDIEGIKALVKYQTENAGTYIAAENIVGGSVEGQFTTSVGKVGEPLIQVVEKEGPLSGKFTYYPEKKPLPSILGGKMSDKAALKKIVDTPEQFLKRETPDKLSDLTNEELQRIMPLMEGEDITFTGGIARKIYTGQGKIRDVDIITNAGKGKELAERVANKYPEVYEVIQHEKYPEIYRLKNKQTGKPVVDFDTVSMAEEGLYTPEGGSIEVNGIKIVKPEVMLKSKATQILEGKARGNKQIENIEQITGEKDILEKIKGESKPNPVAEKVWDFFTAKETKIKFKEMEFQEINEGIIGEETPTLTKAQVIESQGNAPKSVVSESVKKTPLIVSRVEVPKSREVINQTSEPIKIKSSEVSSSNVKSSILSIRSSTPISSEVSSFGSSGSSSSESNPLSSGGRYSSSSVASKISSMTSSSNSFDSSSRSSRSSSQFSSSKLKISSPSETKPPMIISLDKSSKKKKSLFNIEVRRHGKFIKIGQTETPEEAFEIEKKKILSTLAASGKVEQVAGEQVDLKSIGRRILGGARFYESQKEPGVYIQKTRGFGGRLGSRTEVSEIQSAKHQHNILDISKSIFGA